MLNVSEFIVNTLGSGVKICILLGCKTAGSNLGDKIGTPVDNSKITGGPPPMEMNNNNFGNNKRPRMFDRICEFLFCESQDALSRGQLLRLCFSRAVVKVWQAVKVWPLQGFGS